MRLDSSDVENEETRRVEGAEDMIKLSELTEESLLRNIKIRYGNELIYTYTGSILVAVNPYKMFNIYGLDMVKRYEGQVMGSQPPHLFAIGSSSFSKMVSEKENQVIVISGESGAGKTESTKLIMQYLAAVDKATDNLITEQILEASPLLESFGNAKTIRNDNSSRFGKYVEVYFKGSTIVGAKTSEYLLEKSRIGKQAEDERNYHVFYEMLEGLPEERKRALGLTQAEKYFYLNQGGSSQIPSKDDRADFYDLQSAMEVLGLTGREQGTIFRILASILHMGNIFFQRKQNTHHHEGVEMGSDAEIKWISYLLDLSKDWLHEALTMKVTEARRERLLTPLTIDQALDARDGISKALYQRLFTWLVERVNQIVAGNDRDRARATSIALLDIFGFEDFQTNSFEQLCINYANETLQYYFNKHVFRLEQAEYARERIDWTLIDFQDNQPTIDLISKKPHGIVHILDDESNFPKGTDQSFLEKCHYTHAPNPLYSKPRMAGNEFCVRHYAGKVTYSVATFLDKNRDTLRSDVMEMMIKSRNEIISKMFLDLRETTLNRTIAKQGFYVTMRPRTATVAASFHESLVSLVDTMSKCQPWFVRCIKPNNYKAPMEFQTQVVLTQLRYTGMLETIRIRKMGYPVRNRFKDFADKYRALLVEKPRPGTRWEDRQVCERILHKQGPTWKNAWQTGNTKVFLKEAMSHGLETQKNAVLLRKVLIIQTYARGFLARKDFHKIRQAAVTLQAGIRAWVARSRFTKMREGFIKAQAQVRMVQQRRSYLQMKETSRRQAQRAEQPLYGTPVDRMSSGRPSPLNRSRLEMYDHQPPRTLRPISRRDLRGGRQDRTARAQVNVNTLEIPADLAYAISKLDDGQQPHSARQVTGVKGHVQPHNMNHSLPKDIDSHAFNKYVNIYFKEKSQMRKEPITSPLLAKLQDRDAKDAIAVYKLILRFMNDANLTDQREKLMADYIVQKGMSIENLRDEIFGQLCTQTWLNKDNANSERGWQLMCHALSAFQPSPTLRKYLLKYVSDQGYNGYKAFCQHKLLHSLILDPPLPRNYPPSLLEWLAARKRGQMALAVTFADGETTVGHLDSWTTGEEFVSHLLRQRQLAEGDHGWTVVLRDDNNMYELMGYDYVLDLLSEMEVPRGFPYTLAPLLVTTDHSREVPPERKKMFWDSPHNPELPRLVELTTEELRDPVPVSPRPAPEPHNFFRSFSRDNVSREESLYASHDAMSSTSRLNNRSLNNDVKPSLSNSSILNVRYTGGTQKGAPKSPTPEVPIASSSRNGSGPPSHRPSNASSTAGDAAALGGLSTSRLNNRYITPEAGPSSPAPSSSSAAGLATTSRLNQRYANKGAAPLTNGNGVLTNGAGVVPNGIHNGSANGDDLTLSTSRMNSRYAKGPAAGAGRGAAQRPEGGRYVGDRAERMSIKSGNPTDMDQWLDQVFDPILDGTVDDLSDARTVQSKLKGGGRGLPGLTSQTGPYNPSAPNIIATGLNPMQMSGNVTTIPTFSGPATGSIPIGSLQMLGPDPNQLYAQQLAQQQQQNQQQQQAQALLNQHISLQMSQQQAQQAQLAAQVLQHENYDLHNKLHQKDLEKQLLEKTLEYERLKTEIAAQPKTETLANPPTSPRQMPPTPPAPSTQAENTQPQSRPRSTSPQLSPASQQEQVVMRNVTRQAPSGRPGDVRPNIKGGASGEIDTSRPGGVKTLKSKYEKTAPALTPTLFTNRRDSWQPQTSADEDRDSRVQFSDSVQHIPQTPSSPPVEAERTPLLGSAPPAPPPPPPPTLPTAAAAVAVAAASPSNTSPEDARTSTASRSYQGDDSSVTNGVKVKVGTIQWPPPSKEPESKEKRQPNKLKIEQNIIPPAAPPMHGGARSMADAHADMMAHIRARNPDAQPKPKLNQPDPSPTVNMSERKNVLAQQLTLVGVLKGHKDRPSTPPLQQAPPPPPPPPPPATTQVPESSPSPMSVPPAGDDEPDVGRVDLADLRDLEKVKTELFSGQHGPYFTYSGVPWSLKVRKEVFTPTEMLESPALIHLVFCQITQDVFSNAGVRIPKEEKTRMRSMLENNGVTPNNVHRNHKTTMKKMVIDTARDWPYYFARLFPVNGGRRHPAVQVVGVSHSGVKLLAREKDLFEDNLHVVDQLRFEDIIDVSEPKPSVLQIHVNNDYVIVYTPRAAQIKHMIDAYCIESEKNVMYVRAVNDYTTRDPTLLYFHEGDVIKLTNRNMAVDKGWLYGSLYGRTGLFPEEYIKPLAGHELDKYDTGTKPPPPPPQQQEPPPVVVAPAPVPPSVSSSSSSSSADRSQPPARRESYREHVSRDDIYSDASIYSAIPEVQKFSMMEFAMLHFRESPFRYEMIRSEDTGSIHGTFKMISSLKAKTMQRQQSRKRGEKDWTWKEQADMIKWTKSPIQASLLKFDSPQMNKLALESFISIMRYMGDYPLARGQKPIDCVYTILKACHNFPEIKDEVYCQLAKQTTNNRSTKAESLQLGWRLLSIITAYFACTEILKPYLFKYLETTALDLQRPHQTLAAQCLQNLRQTFRYGGRKNVPSRVELEALTRGRNTKRQMCVMPGGVPVVLNIRSCSVVLDAIDQICARLEIQDPLERDEFTIFYVIENGSRYLTLNRDEYIFDITTELANQKKEFYLLFQRTSWVFPLHLDNNPLYIDVMFHQCIPDYLDGFLLPMPTSSLPDNVKVELARLAALQIIANDLRSIPKQRDVMAAIPRTAHGATSSSNWMHLVEREMVEVQNRASIPNRAKVLFLEKLSRWPLFGSTFFNIKSVNEPRVKGESLLAINRAGMHFLHPNTHETLQAYPFTQVVSTRRFHGKDSKNYLEMKVGDLMNQKITRIETDQGVDISALIGQYIHILKRYRN